MKHAKSRDFREGQILAFSVHQYLYTVIIDKIRENGYDEWSKKDIWTNIPRTSEDWEYRYVLEKTISDPTLLTKYHERIPQHYKRSYGSMSDYDLDMLIYKKAFNELA